MSNNVDLQDLLGIGDSGDDYWRGLAEKLDGNDRSDNAARVRPGRGGNSFHSAFAGRGGSGKSPHITGAGGAPE